MNRIMNSTMKRIRLRSLLLTACIISLAIQLFTASSAVAATTLPVLWTAGGLSAGNDSAGQAARIATDASGNVAVVSGPALARSLAVTSYTASGSLRWQRTVSPATGTFVGDWVVAAPNGDFAAVGTNIDSHGNPYGITMVRYAPDGTLLWRVDLARTRPYVARLLADAGGNTYLAFSSIGDGQDIQLHKYNASGVLLWSQLISTGSFANNYATSLALSPDETDVVVTGDVSGGAEWITAVYNATTGARRWLVTAAEGTAALDVVVDGGAVYVTGQGSVGIYGFLTVVAYDRATGARLWRSDKKAADSTGAAGLRMALGPDGSLVVTGQTSRGFLDWYTVAFETSGAVRWEAVRDGGLNTDEIPRRVLVLADGTTVVTGPGGPNLPGGYIQGVTAGYSTNGTLLWEGFSRQATVWATALPNGDVCATGGYDALITCWQVSGGVPFNQPPVAVASAMPTSGVAPLSVSFSSVGSFDPDGSIAGYQWNFGDSLNETQGPSATHTYSASGVYQARLTVTDDMGTTSTSSVTITVQLALSSMFVSPYSVTGGASAQGTAFLTGPAPAGGAVVTLSSSNPAAAAVPASVTVPAGATSASFPITTSTVTASTAVVITGNYTRLASATLTVLPSPAVTGLILTPNSLKGGSFAYGTVTLSAPAPALGTVVSLSSSQSKTASVPATATVTQGMTTGTFPISTSRVRKVTTVNISAAIGSSQKTATLSVTP